KRSTRKSYTVVQGPGTIYTRLGATPSRTGNGAASISWARRNDLMATGLNRLEKALLPARRQAVQLGTTQCRLAFYCPCRHQTADPPLAAAQTQPVRAALSESRRAGARDRAWFYLPLPKAR